MCIDKLEMSPFYITAEFITTWLLDGRSKGKRLSQGVFEMKKIARS